LETKGIFRTSSVKWLRKITLIPYEFKGPFQAIDYVYYPFKNNDMGKTPVTLINVNSTILQPMDLSQIDPGQVFTRFSEWLGLEWEPFQK
jgi:hypothetical protein